MARILLAWEGGAGRGHLVTLKTVAQALGPRHQYEAALCRLQYEPEIAPLCSATYQGVALRYDTSARSRPGDPGTATWGEFMGDLGFRNEALIAANIEWYQRLLIGRDIDLVVGDYAPFALMAARSIGIPAAGIGTGYGLPPPHLAEFPILLPEHATRLYDEAEMVAAINSGAGPLGVPIIDRLPAVYDADAHLVRSLPMLDPYFADRTEPLLPPVADVSSRIGEGGDEIFAYFSTTELENPALVEAVATLNVPLRVFAPGASAEKRAQLAAGGAILEAAPVPVDLIAQRSRLMVHSAQHGIVCLGLAAGLPQVGFPQHLEHLYMGRRAAERGAFSVIMGGQTAATIRQTILDAYHDEARLRTARALAHELRPLFSVDPAERLRERLLPLIG